MADPQTASPCLAKQAGVITVADAGWVVLGPKRRSPFGPATHLWAAVSPESTGWCAEASVEAVGPRGVKLAYRFLRGEKGEGGVLYSVAGGSAYVAHSAYGTSPGARTHFVGLDAEGGVSWFSEALWLGAFWLELRGRDLQAERDQAKAAFDAREKADPLPPLLGTEGQVGWAKELRRAFVERLPHRRTAACRKMDAGWWIDHREDLERLR